MTITADTIMSFDGQILPFSRDLREALGVYARRKWPLNTSGHVAKAWGIPKSTAANLMKGIASDATVTAILRAGGWELALPVIGAVIGHPVDQFFRAQMKSAAREAQRAEQHEQLAAAAYRHLASDPARDRDAGDRAATARETRRGAGAVGAEEARRVGDQR